LPWATREQEYWIRLLEARGGRQHDDIQINLAPGLGCAILENLKRRTFDFGIDTFNATAVECQRTFAGGTGLATAAGK
jgi:hypothetical protein